MSIDIDALRRIPDTLLLHFHRVRYGLPPAAARLSHRTSFTPAPAHRSRNRSACCWLAYHPRGSPPRSPSRAETARLVSASAAFSAALSNESGSTVSIRSFRLLAFTLLAGYMLTLSGKETVSRSAKFMVSLRFLPPRAWMPKSEKRHGR